jgi:hypothetical protein
MRAQSVKSLLVVSLWRSIAFERCLILPQENNRRRPREAGRSDAAVGIMLTEIASEAGCPHELAREFGAAMEQPSVPTLQSLTQAVVETSARRNKWRSAGPVLNQSDRRRPPWAARVNAS